MNTSDTTDPMLPKLLIAGLIALAVMWLYLPVRGFDFICFDDGMYVYQEDQVRSGLTWHAIKWAFTNTGTGNWHPLTWLSLMADVQLFGVHAGAIHLVNAGYHALAAGLLFLFLCAFVKRYANVSEPALVWSAAAFGAMLWAVHPLRVESVAWVSSRKDVVSVIFCLLGIWAYWRDSRAWWDGRARQQGWRILDPAGLRSVSWSFWAAVACFILGYMSKPTLMVFPAFVLLLEWLETGRVRWKLIAFLGVIAIAFFGLTVFAQDDAIDAGIPFVVRLKNAAVSVSIYVRQFFVPTQLAVFYPYETPLAWLPVVMGLCVIGYLFYLAVTCWARCPMLTLAIGWFFAGLVPVIGLIHVGSASHADRYTYLPTLGLSFAGAAGLGYLFRRFQASAWVPALAAVGAAFVCVEAALLSRAYINVWKNSGTLFEHAAKVTKKNAMAHTNAGSYYARMPEEKDRVLYHYQKALEYERTFECLGNLSLWVQMNMDDAYLDQAGALAQEAMGKPHRKRDYVAFDAMGNYLLRKKQYAEAEPFLRESVSLNPFNPIVWEWLAACYFKQGKYREAAEAAQEALKIEPANKRYEMMVNDALRRAGGAKP